MPQATRKANYKTNAILTRQRSRRAPPSAPSEPSKKPTGEQSHIVDPFNQILSHYIRTEDSKGSLLAVQQMELVGVKPLDSSFDKLMNFLARDGDVQAMESAQAYWPHLEVPSGLVEKAAMAAKEVKSSPPVPEAKKTTATKIVEPKKSPAAAVAKPQRPTTFDSKTVNEIAKAIGSKDGDQLLAIFNEATSQNSYPTADLYAAMLKFFLDEKRDMISAKTVWNHLLDRKSPVTGLEEVIGRTLIGFASYGDFVSVAEAATRLNLKRTVDFSHPSLWNAPLEAFARAIAHLQRADPKLEPSLARGCFLVARELWESRKFSRVVDAQLLPEGIWRDSFWVGRLGPRLHLSVLRPMMELAEYGARASEIDLLWDQCVHHIRVAAETYYPQPESYPAMGRICGSYMAALVKVGRYDDAVLFATRQSSQFTKFAQYRQQAMGMLIYAWNKNKVPPFAQHKMPLSEVAQRLTEVYGKKDVDRAFDYSKRLRDKENAPLAKGRPEDGEAGNDLAVRKPGQRSHGQGGWTNRSRTAGDNFHNLEGAAHSQGRPRRHSDFTSNVAVPNGRDVGRG